MSNSILVIVLLIGTTLMSWLIMLQMKQYGVVLWKSIPVAITLVVTGVVGSYLWYFVENFSFGGRSFYGAVFFSPIVFLLVAKLLKICYSDTMDFVAPAGCVTLAMVKIICIRDRCCQGRVLFLNEDHIFVRFPSQIVEMVAFLVISAILMWMVSKRKFRGTIFLWFLVIYGACRFVLDFFRDIEASYILGLSAGSFWSLCAFITGILILLVIRLKRYSKIKRKSEIIKE